MPVKIEGKIDGTIRTGDKETVETICYERVRFPLGLFK